MKALLLLVTALLGAACASLADTAISTLPASRPCFSLLHSSGAVGCVSKGLRVQGALRWLAGPQGLSPLQDSPGSDKAQALVISSGSLSASNITLLRDKFPSIAGIIVLEDGSRPQASSNDSPYPQGSSYPWNPHGDGLLEQTLPFAMVYINDSEIASKLYKQALVNENTDSDFDPYVAEFSFDMSAVDNSRACLRSGRCLPVGGFSVWSSLGGAPQGGSVLASASIDSWSIFPLIDSVGAEGKISGVVALLAALEVLSRLELSELQSLPYQIRFAFFQAESFGYAGSRRFIYDIDNFNCTDLSEGRCVRPFYRYDLSFKDFDLNNMVAHINVDQVGIPGGLYFHPGTNSLSKNLAQVMESTASSISSLTSSLSSISDVPPSPAVPFLDRLPGLPTVVLSDFDTSYKNPFFHSTFDVPRDSISSDQICKAATLTARSLYRAAANDSSAEVTGILSNCTLVEELLDCLTKNLKCDLSKRMGIESILSDSPDALAKYPSVYLPNLNPSSSASSIEAFVFNFVSLYSRTKNDSASCSKDSDCSGPNPSCVSSSCFTSHSFYHDAYDPGISYSFRSGRVVFQVVNGTYPNWAESFWGVFDLRLYRRETFSSSLAIFLLGIAVSIGSAFLVRYSLQAASLKYKI